MKKIFITGELDGKEVFSTPHTEADDDWIRAARLQKAAKAGDKKAQKQLNRLEKTVMITDGENK
ncbi:MAG: hypothetical protein PHD00_09055 [Bacteroidales bacterium]|nr:hypothetical protein [Bacteroidales bacterium]MDD4673172.1 hypothetical protein [Bacteroidales bacterium]MDY0348881.1 hypothetical protein [Tenuifilaceae bacterium]